MEGDGERAAQQSAPHPMMIIMVMHHSVASAARDGIPCLVELLFLHKDFFHFLYNYPALRAPVAGYACFSSSLGRVKASFPLHSLFRQFFGKKGNYRAIFLKVAEE